MDKIPVIPKFNITTYVETELKSHERIFRAKCASEYELYDSLVRSFSAHMEKNGEPPFTFRQRLAIAELTFVQKMAIESFQLDIATKGYVCRYEVVDVRQNPSYSNVYDLVVTIKW